MPKTCELSYVASESEKAQKVAKFLEQKYSINCFDQNSKTKFLLVLGGDGFLLNTVKKISASYIYGINCGNVGFLLNTLCKETLLEDIENSVCYKLPFLKANVVFIDGSSKTYWALNDIQITRHCPKAVMLDVHLNDERVLQNLVGDGVLISTPVGSTAYNFSAGGPILPVETRAIVLTPINTFSPKYFRSTILNCKHKISIVVKECKRRPAVFVADLQECKNVEKIDIIYNIKNTVNLLFKKDRTIEDKVLAYQFS